MSINDSPVSDNGPWAPDVVFDSLNNEYKMWYEAEYSTLNINIFMATTPRNILNSTNCLTTISADTTINGGDSITLTAGGRSIFHWQPSAELNDPTIATPIASPDSTTTYTVLIVGDSCVTTEMVTVSINPLWLNNQPSSKQQVKIYPNPTNELVNIYIENGFENEHFIELYSVVGKKIKTKMTPKRETIMKLKGLPAGVYYIVVYNHNGDRWTKKIIKYAIMYIKNRRDSNNIKDCNPFQFS